MDSAPLLISPVDAPTTWWARYSEALSHSGINEVGCEVIDADSTYIVDEVTNVDNWPESRFRSGAVMGAVQSGKTASMIAVAAKCLDRGIDIIIFLAGTRTTLWSQTLNRIANQLGISETDSTERVFLPVQRDLAGGKSTDLSQLYSITKSQAALALSEQRPFIFCAMKQVDHLEALSKVLHQNIYPAVKNLGRPVRVLVIDDEADDSSIDGEGTELSLEYKQIPRRIIDLWEDRSNTGFTATSDIFATYLAYTATPQANFLMDDSNILYPRNFIASLRTPYDSGQLSPRSSTYWVPEGLTGWYTGGEIYYKRFADVPLCLTPNDLQEVPSVTESLDEDQVIDAVRSFLVASALRLLRKPGRLSPVLARASAFRSQSEASKVLPAVSSMLVHPSAMTGKHFEFRNTILNWSNGNPETLPASSNILGHTGVLTDMEENIDRWHFWLRNYAMGTSKIEQNAGVKLSPFPIGPELWELVKAYITDQIIPLTRVAVINSDPSSDHRPSFDIQFDKDKDAWLAPADLSTIFVAGSVMSRGLTLEGLLTTSFGRVADSPLADTQMQMQRWFGYRGSYIDLCRVFMTEPQRELFEHYHDTDVVMRNQVLNKMGQNPGDNAWVPAVLQGSRYLATGKIKPLSSQTLDPGARPFGRYLNPVSEDNSNQLALAHLFQDATTNFLVLGDDSHLRGVLRKDRFSLLEVSDILDQFSYDSQLTSIKPDSSERWAEVERLISLPPGDVCSPLYRGPATDMQLQHGFPSTHEIAAYLRFWNACLDRSPQGVESNTARPRRWSLMSHADKHSLAPAFSIGIRFGSGDQVTTGPLTNLPFAVYPMQRTVGSNGVLDSTWGTRGTGFGISDENFDSHLRRRAPEIDVNGRRAAGENGLLLFHVIDRGDNEVSITYGLALPAGGPELHIARN